MFEIAAYSVANTIPQLRDMPTEGFCTVVLHGIRECGVLY